MLRSKGILFVLSIALTVPLFAKDKPKQKAVLPPSPSNPAFDRFVDKMIARETVNLKALRKMTPVAETYVQEIVADDDLGTRPTGDDYMLGRVSFEGETEHLTMIGPGTGSQQKEEEKSSHFLKMPKMSMPKIRLFHRSGGSSDGSGEDKFAAVGFAHMAEIDGRGLDHEHYKFQYVGRQFLGELRCLVIDVSPKEDAPNLGEGRFLGRVWVEDVDFNIVRFNGTWSPQARKGGLYLHFDTWRLNVQPGVWLPAYIYSEESDIATAWAKHARFKSQTRFWAYNVNRDQAQSSFTQVLVEPDSKVADKSDAAQDLPPVASQRAWEREAEDNALNRMERAGLLAKSGDVDKILTTVLNNLIITNNLNIEPEVRARVMLTTPIETFSVGHTVVISRGLLDVLPDEACLAAVMANELAHIILGHRIDTKYAFDDRLIFADDDALRHLHFERNSVEQKAADIKAMELLQNSPYKDKLASVGLFLRQVEDRETVLPHLVRARLGHSILMDDKQLRLGALKERSTALAKTKIEQLAALPLGGRIKVNPWNDTIEMVMAKPVAILSPSEKMPLELTPVFPYLTRLPKDGAEQPADEQPEKPVSPTRETGTSDQPARLASVSAGD